MAYTGLLVLYGALKLVLALSSLFMNLSYRTVKLETYN